MNPSPLSPLARVAVLEAACLGLLFDGIEPGLMPIASWSVSKSLLGDGYTEAAAGDWLARFTAALMLGAAIGGIVLGNLGDRIGRTRAMGISILFYSVFAALGTWVRTQEEMLILRFLVGLGVGGMWPNGMALVAECWPAASRPLVSGVMSAALNAGILLLSQLARIWPITPDSWRWIFLLAGIPAVLGVVVLAFLPESPTWLANRQTTKQPPPPVRELFQPELLRIILVAILLASIPLVGAWSASKWMIPWADQVAGSTNAPYKAATQGWWALGATIGSFTGAQLAGWLGRRLSYLLISLGSTLLTLAMFQLTAPLETSFHPIVFAQGFVATLFFGWLAVFLPELFPTRVRATGSGLAFNSGRFVTAAGGVFALLGGDYPRVGAICSMVYGLGAIAIGFAPARRQELDS
ncbi:MAG: MFS transporter [Planctomycetes bacterium]|nr:MFS transporter [Planctomycetota bacterium]MBM4097687.1 MFS transporter [Planctomycetota bacterium]